MLAVVENHSDTVNSLMLYCGIGLNATGFLNVYNETAMNFCNSTILSNRHR